MGTGEEVSADSIGPNELTPEEARKMRKYYLALAEINTKIGESDSDEIDSADSGLATFILPGD